MSVPDIVSIKNVSIALSLLCIFVLVNFMNANTNMNTNNLLTNTITNRSGTTHQQDDELTLLLKENQNLRKQLNHLSVSGNINSTEITASAFDDGNKSKNDIIYGHVHVAKTGGTSLNGMLANKFERVCGNKGNFIP